MGDNISVVASLSTPLLPLQPLHALLGLSMPLGNLPKCTLLYDAHTFSLFRSWRASRTALFRIASCREQQIAVVI